MNVIARALVAQRASISALQGWTFRTDSELDKGVVGQVKTVIKVRTSPSLSQAVVPFEALETVSSTAQAPTMDEIVRQLVYHLDRKSFAADDAMVHGAYLVAWDDETGLAGGHVATLRWVGRASWWGAA